MTGMPGAPIYRRVLLKLSGEALMGSDAYGINREVLMRIASEIKAVRDSGVQLAVVIGGGNIFRGVAPSAQGMERTTADSMGMLATVINALALQDALERADVAVRVQSALRMDQVVEFYTHRRARYHLEKGRVVIFAGGTGNPFFTTDTAASLRAMEIEADIMLKATNVDGVYSKDPARYSDARRYDEISYSKVLERRLGVMDAASIVLCRDRKLPIRVFNIKKPGSLIRVVKGEKEGTLVRSDH